MNQLTNPRHQAADHGMQGKHSAQSHAQPKQFTVTCQPSMEAECDILKRCAVLNYAHCFTEGWLSFKVCKARVEKHTCTC